MRNSFRGNQKNEFIIYKIIKPINIQIFENLTITHQVLESKLPQKDLIIGFDILIQIQNHAFTPTGITYKCQLLPWTCYHNIPIFHYLTLPASQNHSSKSQSQQNVTEHYDFSLGLKALYVNKRSKYIREKLRQLSIAKP